MDRHVGILGASLLAIASWSAEGIAAPDQTWGAHPAEHHAYPTSTLAASIEAPYRHIITFGQLQTEQERSKGSWMIQPPDGQFVFGLVLTSDIAFDAADFSTENHGSRLDSAAVVELVLADSSGTEVSTQRLNLNALEFRALIDRESAALFPGQHVTFAYHHPAERIRLEAGTTYSVNISVTAPAPMRQPVHVYPVLIIPGAKHVTMY